MVSRAPADAFGVFAIGVNTDGENVDDTEMLYCVTSTPREAIKWMAQWLVMPRAFDLLELPHFHAMVAKLYRLVDQADITQELRIGGVVYYVRQLMTDEIPEIQAVNQPLT